MPILVTCPGCKAQFNVSEKFAGKQGPCPKCKAVITIPKGNAAPAAAEPPAAPAAGKKAGSPAAAPPPPPPARAAAGPPPEVKIHAPDDAPQAGKTRTGAASLKPLARTDARLTPKLMMIVGGLTVALFVAAWFGGRFVQSPAPLTTEEESSEELVAARRMEMLPIFGLRALGLLLIGWPIVVAGYAVLRDDELEPYRGRDLLRRVLICLAVYIAVWGIYAFIPDDLLGEPIVLGAMIPALLLPAAVAAYFCFDLDYLGSAIHASFFFLVTLALGATAGLTMPWAIPTDDDEYADSAGPYVPQTQIEVTRP
jgi:hypothetical protein